MHLLNQVHHLHDDASQFRKFRLYGFVTVPGCHGSLLVGQRSTAISARRGPLHREATQARARLKRVDLGLGVGPTVAGANGDKREVRSIPRVSVLVEEALPRSWTEGSSQALVAGSSGPFRLGLPVASRLSGMQGAQREGVDRSTVSEMYVT